MRAYILNAMKTVMMHLTQMMAYLTHENNTGNLETLIYKEFNLDLGLTKLC